MSINAYYDTEHMRRSIEAGKHREIIGGLWDQIGRLQFDYLVAHGLKPDMHVLDIGCGCLRVGVHLVEYLQTNHYFGIDLSQDLLEVGWRVELQQAGVQHKLRRDNLLSDAEFRFNRFEMTFDIAIAQSLFTHLPLNHIKLCLVNLAGVMAVGGSFYATLFHCDDRQDWSQPIVHERGGITTYPAKDPYHYRFADLEHCIRDLPWTVTPPQDWKHPRNQALVTFSRVEG